MYDKSGNLTFNRTTQRAIQMSLHTRGILLWEIEVLPTEKHPTIKKYGGWVTSSSSAKLWLEGGTPSDIIEEPE